MTKSLHIISFIKKMFSTPPLKKNKNKTPHLKKGPHFPAEQADKLKKVITFVGIGSSVSSFWVGGGGGRALQMYLIRASKRLKIIYFQPSKYICIRAIKAVSLLDTTPLNKSPYFLGLCTNQPTFGSQFELLSDFCL